MRLVVLYGPPGVGKLTVGTALSELTGFKLFLHHLTVNLVTSVFPPGSMRVRLHCLQRSPPHRQDLHFILGTVRIANPSVQMLELRRMISSARGRAIIEALPKGRVLTETDGPFTRVADRPTTPADVSIVVSHLAAIWRQQESEVVKQLQRNLRAAVPPANNESIG